jgi:SRSO17 transposase
VIYDLLKREDADWRNLNLATAKQVYLQRKISNHKLKAYVLDDSIKQRRGKKMEGAACHFDHTEGRHVMGQQVLTLGLVSDEVFLPLDSQIFVSDSRAIELNHPFKDQRSIIAKRYKEATTLSKPEMAEQMLKRVKKQGIKADYLIADAWFGTKAIIKTALAQQLTPVLRMKKNKTKYRVQIGGKSQNLDAKELYQRLVKKQWRKVHNMPYRAVEIDVELSLSESNEKADKWIKAKLLFVRGLKDDATAQASQKDWALFLTTDTTMGLSKMLEIYALRWAIEVYFKEAKQHLGFLQEQTRSFASHIASIHLTAIRYLMLVYAKCEYDDLRVCDMRASIKDQLKTLDYAQRLWHLFRALICNALDKISVSLGETADEIIQAIDRQVECFFVNALQLDVFTMKMEFEA